MFLRHLSDPVGNPGCGCSDTCCPADPALSGSCRWSGNSTFLLLPPAAVWRRGVLAGPAGWEALCATWFSPLYTGTAAEPGGSDALSETDRHPPQQSCGVTPEIATFVPILCLTSGTLVLHTAPISGIAPEANDGGVSAARRVCACGDAGEPIQFKRRRTAMAALFPRAGPEPGACRPAPQSWSRDARQRMLRARFQLGSRSNLSRKKRVPLSHCRGENCACATPGGERGRAR